MTEKSKAQRRREAAEYWDTHGIDEGVTDDDVEEAFEVRKPLAAMLTFRLDEDDLANAGNGVDGGSGSAPQAETTTYKSSAIPQPGSPDVAALKSLQGWSHSEVLPTMVLI